MNYLVKDLFPRPLYVTALERQFTDAEMEVFDDVSKNLQQNTFNLQSQDVDVLERPEMKELKEFVLSHINNYKEDILSVRDEVDFYITQSWMNYTGNEEMHHEHWHPNSIISGVMYIQTNEKDSVSFIKDVEKRTIQFSLPKAYNKYNTDEMHIPVKNNMLLLFPSDIYHRVNTKKTDGDRISMAFNTFIRGKLNHPQGLQYLEL